MSSRYTDTVYDHNSPTAQNRAKGAGGPDDPYVSSRGYSSNEERLTSAALAAVLSSPADEIREIRPNFARRTPLFPDRFIGPRTQPTINDVVDMSRRYPDSSAEFSGSSGGYQGTVSPSLGA